jgi:hypothetical protein
MRFRFIEDRRADYQLTIMCDALDVSPAGCYAWRARPEGPEPPPIVSLRRHSVIGYLSPIAMEPKAA